MIKAATKREDFNVLPDRDLLALCIWREARGESFPAKTGVCNTILNRVREGGWFGKTLKNVILRPYQFSSFNPNDVNFNKFPQGTDLSWLDCVHIAETQLATFTPSEDITKGATFYYDKSLDAKPPCWAADMCESAIIGRLRFFRTLQKMQHQDCATCSLSSLKPKPPILTPSA